jgi:hypothetical protein
MSSAVVQLKSAIIVDERQILCAFDKRECLSPKEARENVREIKIYDARLVR